VKLDPTTHAYAINLIHLLMNDNRDEDARKLAQNLLEKTRSPEEAQTARELLKQIKDHEEWVALRKKELEASANAPATSMAVSAPAAVQTVAASSAAAPVDTSTLMAVDGVIRRIDCTHKPGIMVTLGGGNRPLIFRAADFSAVGVTGADDETRRLDSCEKWKGRKIRLWFRAAKGKEYLGEITDIAFE
jgi:hypothetical protein